MKCDKKTMLLYAVTDRAWVGRQSLYEQVECALKGGATCVQVREKKLGDEDFLEEAKQIAALCKRCGVPLFINDNVDVAIACGAEGVHVGQEDMAAAKVREKVGNKMMIGVSVHSVEEAKQAVRDGADCLGVGAMFSTSTKTDVDVLPKETLKAICDAVDIPVVAIGGLNKSNILELSGAGQRHLLGGGHRKRMPRAARAVGKNGERMKLKCVIFDFDGTLFDSMYLWDTVAESYVRSRGKEPKPTVREEVRALSLLQAAEHLKKEYDLAETPEEIMAGIDGIIEHFYRDEVQPKPGVVPFLKELRAKGVDVCIATATDRYLIEAALRRCGIENLFDAIFTCSEVGHGKDEPVIFRRAMEHFGAQRGSTVVFEDAIHAIETAKKDGFTVAAVFDESEKRQDEVRALADCYITSFEHLEQFWAMTAAD